jgi:hypothetical protein
MYTYICVYLFTMLRQDPLNQWSSTWYMKTSYTNQNKTQELLEPRTSSDPHTHEDSSPNWGADMQETSSIISLTGQKNIHNWYLII